MGAGGRIKSKKKRGPSRPAHPDANPDWSGVGYGHPEWKTSILGCFSDIGGCCEAIICCPCVYGYTMNELAAWGRGGYPEFSPVEPGWCMAGFDLGAGFDLAFTVQTLGIINAFSQKKNTRLIAERYNMNKSSECANFLEAWFLPCCTAARNYRELAMRGEPPKSVLGCAKTEYEGVVRPMPLNLEKWRAYRENIEAGINPADLLAIQQPQQVDPDNTAAPSHQQEGGALGFMSPPLLGQQQQAPNANAEATSSSGMMVNQEMN